jgi:hypothetical protein
MKRIEREGPIAFTFAVMTEKQKEAAATKRPTGQTQNS